MKNKVYDYLTKPKTVKISTIIAFTIVSLALIIGYIIAAVFGTKGYNMIDNYISDMGNSEYTPFPYMRTIGNVISGPFFIPLTFFIRKQLMSQIQENQEKKPQIINLAFFGMLMIFLNMIVTGIITLDVNREIHVLFATFAIIGGIISTISYGLVIIIYRTNIPHSIGVYMILVMPIIIILLVIGFPSYVFYEWVYLFSIYAWIILVCFYLFDKNR